MKQFILTKEQKEMLGREIADLQEKIQTDSTKGIHRIHIHGNIIMHEPKDLRQFERLIYLTQVYENALVKEEINTDSIDIGSCFSVTVRTDDGEVKTRVYQLLDYWDTNMFRRAEYYDRPIPMLTCEEFGRVVYGKKSGDVFDCYYDEEDGTKKHALAMINEIYTNEKSISDKQKVK